jgi:cysteinyl-tRNA synthetase
MKKSERKILEENLVEKTFKLHHIIYETKPQYTWTDCEEFDDFIVAWGELGRYYRRHDDDVVSAHVLKSYAMMVPIFRKALLDNINKPEAFEAIEEAIGEVETVVDELLRHAVSNAYRKDQTE